MINSGTFFIKKGDWSRELMKIIYGDDHSVWVDHPWWENAALTFHLTKDTIVTFLNEDKELEAWPTLSSGGAQGVELAGGTITAGQSKVKKFAELSEGEREW